MYSAGRMNQFKWKTPVLNLWLMSQSKVICEAQIEFKNKLGEIAVPTFCETNDNTPGFCLVLS